MEIVRRLTCPFELRGFAGRVLVTLSRNDDPRRLGHPLVARNFDQRAFTGFPIVEAEIEYEGRGLFAAMGWIQAIQHIDRNGVATEFAVDRFPLGPEDSPLYTYGYLPRFFDAPANPDHPDGTWCANTWLIAIPDVIRTRRVAAVTGFSWGYRLADHRPELLDPELLTRSAWLSLALRLKIESPSWSFLDEPL